MYPSFYKKGAAVFGALTILGAAVFATLSATNGTFTNLSSTNATTTNLVVTGAATLPGTLSVTVPNFTIGILTVTSTSVLTGAVNAPTSIITPSLAASSTVLGQGGTAIDKHVRTTATINVDPISAMSGTSSAIALTGAGTTDHCSVSVLSGDFLSTTSTADYACKFTAADTATIYFRNWMPTSTFDGGSSVFSVQGTSY